MNYIMIADLDAGARSFDDVTANRGIDYFYYIQAIGEVNTNSTGMTPTGVPLRSGRYYTQTYLPANLKRPPKTVDDVQVVPNPWYISADEEFRFGENDNRLAFFDIPGQCTIKIYTQLGELVKTIEHTNDSGDEFWLQDTESRQLVVSGIYIAVITDNNTGESTTKKFVIIR